MQQDNSSFWTDIKSFEERLDKSPESFCFARLSEVYLKVGLLDDALHTARQGVAKHPAYLAGQRALAMACHAKGFNDECLAALQRVTEAMPEDHESLKLLGRMSDGIGDRNAARQAFQTVLEFNPDDVECRLELELLDHAGAPVLSSNNFDEYDEYDDEEIIEDLEILEELDVLEEDESVSDFQFQETTSEAAPYASSIEPHHDPLSTSTLAELYVAQGFIHKALDIYHAILTADPSNCDVSARVAELELQAADADAGSPSLADEYFCEEEFAEEPYTVPAVMADVQQPANSYDLAPEHSCFTEVLEKEKTAFIPPFRNSGSEVPPQGTADSALATLEGWLENIGRIRSCR